MVGLSNRTYINLFKRIIIQNQERINNLKVYNRIIKIEDKANNIFLGLRRVGKTYMLYQIIKKYTNINDILLINFEDERLIELNYQQLDLILDAYAELYDSKPVIFLDEIHNIENWDKFVRRLADLDYKLMITGSNAKMLSSDISTVLGGRFFNITVYPLSFEEYINFNNLNLKRNFEYTDQLKDVKKLYSNYLKFGALPELVKYDNKREYLSNVYQKLFYGDVIARYKISNPRALKLLIKKLAESVNNETSINRIKNIIKSAGIPIGNNTLFDYIEYLNSAFLIDYISNYNYKIVERESKKKYYFADTGLLALFLFDQDTKLLENQVFIELKRRFNDDIFYYKKQLEVDFFIPSKSLLIQVSYNIDNEETRKREIKALILAMNDLKINTGYIITYDTDDFIEIEGNKIIVQPAWKWLLETY